MSDKPTNEAYAEAIRRANAELLNFPYCSLDPTLKQAAFLLDRDREALYGGAAGGGKSVALLMAFLQYAGIPGYHGLILRSSLTDLRLPNGLLAVARTWFAKHASWSREDNKFTFPSGSTLTFGYLENAGDELRYQGAEFQYIAFDELTQFTEDQYRYLFSRLRRVKVGPASTIPLRMRSATNPGGPGHDWVHRRFIMPNQAWLEGVGPPADPRFWPAKLADNPYLDQEDYLQSLDLLGPVARAQLRDGDWNIRPEGRLFKGDWFPIVSASSVPADAKRVRYWDLAATPARPGRDPDFSVGLLLARSPDGRYFVEDVVRFRGTPLQGERRLRATAERDGRMVPIYIELEPASGGPYAIDQFQRNALDGYTVIGKRPLGPKVQRAEQVACRAEAGHIELVAGDWNAALLDELGIFPDGAHDDQVDALSGAYGVLSTPQIPVCGPLGSTRPSRSRAY